MLMLVFSREVRVLLETLFRPFAELALERAAAELLFWRAAAALLF